MRDSIHYDIIEMVYRIMVVVLRTVITMMTRRVIVHVGRQSHKTNWPSATRSMWCCCFISVCGCVCDRSVAAAIAAVACTFRCRSHRHRRRIVACSRGAEEKAADRFLRGRVAATPHPLGCSVRRPRCRSRMQHAARGAFARARGHRSRANSENMFARFGRTASKFARTWPNYVCSDRLGTH